MNVRIPLLLAVIASWLHPVEAKADKAWISCKLMSVDQYSGAGKLGGFGAYFPIAAVLACENHDMGASFADALSAIIRIGDDICAYDVLMAPDFEYDLARKIVHEIAQKNADGECPPYSDSKYTRLDWPDTIEESAKIYRIVFRSLARAALSADAEREMMSEFQFPSPSIEASAREFWSNMRGASEQSIPGFFVEHIQQSRTDLGEDYDLEVFVSIGRQDWMIGVVLAGESMLIRDMSIVE